MINHGKNITPQWTAQCGWSGGWAGLGYANTRKSLVSLSTTMYAADDTDVYCLSVKFTTFSDDL